VAQETVTRPQLENATLALNQLKKVIGKQQATTL